MASFRNYLNTLNLLLQTSAKRMAFPGPGELERNFDVLMKGVFCSEARAGFRQRGKHSSVFSHAPGF